MPWSTREQGEQAREQQLRLERARLEEAAVLHEEESLHSLMEAEENIGATNLFNSSHFLCHQRKEVCLANPLNPYLLQ